MFYQNYRTKWGCNESYRDIQCSVCCWFCSHCFTSLVFGNEMAMVHYEFNFLKSVIFFNFRGGPVDSTEELPVKIEVHSLSHMMVYLADACLKRKMKVFSLEYYYLKVKIGIHWEVSVREVQNTSLCQHLFETSFWYLVYSHFCHQYLSLLRAPPLPLSLVFPLLFLTLFPSSSACLAFFCLSYVCFLWGTAILAAGTSCGLDTAVQHPGTPGCSS